MANGKAENLSILSQIPDISVPEFIVLTPNLSQIESARAVSAFIDVIPLGSLLAIRSSASCEDSDTASFAGMYSTELGVEAVLESVMDAVARVRLSAQAKQSVVYHYATQRQLTMAEIDLGMEVIVQRMIDAEIGGVIFSHDLTEPDSYYAVSVATGLGDAIVGGASNGQLIRIARGIRPSYLQESWLRDLLGSMMAIERHFQSTSLDVEFAIKDGIVYILQCRPITTVPVSTKEVTESEIMLRINELESMITSDFDGDVLGDMTDINPMELLGTSPSPLDISIFRHLFADTVVEDVRREMGYDPLHIGLLRVVAGKPYVSVRASAYSFRPQGISSEIYERIVRVYLKSLVQDQSLQSRVEFDLYAMSAGDKLERIMAEAGLNDHEKATVRMAFARIDDSFLRVSEHYQLVFDSLARRYEEFTLSLHCGSLDAILEHITTGTRLFVLVARLAFYWKNKFEETYPNEDLNALITGYIQTVNGRLESDLLACKNGKLTREELILRYGHLRPGQFSVFGECYADDPDTYLFRNLENVRSADVKRQAHQLEETPEFKYVITFMQAREQMKFLFMKPFHQLSVVLRRTLTESGIEPAEAARLSWKTLCSRLSNKSILEIEPSHNQVRVILPSVIIPGITDLRVISFIAAHPTFITNMTVKARVCVLEQIGLKADLSGAIVLLPTADPGFDFLFHSGAAGLVTKVGGPASHMCIRAIELQLPACIGCGEGLYQELLAANHAILDCASKQIIILD